MLFLAEEAEALLFIARQLTKKRFSLRCKIIMMKRSEQIFVPEPDTHGSSSIELLRRGFWNSNKRTFNMKVLDERLIVDMKKFLTSFLNLGCFKALLTFGRSPLLMQRTPKLNILLKLNRASFWNRKKVKQSLKARVFQSLSISFRKSTALCRIVGTRPAHCKCHLACDNIIIKPIASPRSTTNDIH